MPNHYPEENWIICLLLWTGIFKFSAQDSEVAYIFQATSKFLKKDAFFTSSIFKFIFFDNFSMSRYSYEMGSDGFDSPGSSIFGKPGFNFLPYGVHSPSADSLMSTGSREMMSGSYMGMKIFFKNFIFLKLL